VGEGHLRGELEARARDLGLAERLVFRGKVADVPRLLADWDVGVLCSDSEGFSNALLEYMLAGCAAVATDVGGNREALADGETGLLVPPGDAAALAAAIGRCLADGDLCARLAAAARRTAAARYDWTACVRAHEELYAGLWARHGR
jgi:glycosyltransferase involved in cell wall biosynthesis